LQALPFFVIDGGHSICWTVPAQLLQLIARSEIIALDGVPIVNYRVFFNPEPHQLSSFIHSVSLALRVNPKAIPCGRAFEEMEGAYMDQFSRIALGWKHDRERHQLIVRVVWL
jgi:hypothetical protein